MAIRVLLFSALAVSLAIGQESPAVTELNPNLLVFGTSAGNVVCSVGQDGALLIGTPSASSTAFIADTLQKRTKSPVRYVVIFPEDVDHSEGDGGWTSRGAFVAMQESALERLGGHVMGPNHSLPRRLIDLGVDRPHISFSEVLSFDMNGDAIHIVRQQPGYSNADAIAHVHVGQLIYMGEVFPGDGYPEIDAKQGGTLNGLLQTVNAWAGSPLHIVPARGKVANGADLKDFRDMVVSVRTRVQSLVDSGKTEEEAIAAHPTAEFDAQWGHGRVTPDAFVREIYSALKTPAKLTR